MLVERDPLPKTFRELFDKETIEGFERHGFNMDEKLLEEPPKVAMTDCVRIDGKVIPCSSVDSEYPPDDLSIATTLVCKEGDVQVIEVKVKSARLDCTVVCTLKTMDTIEDVVLARMVRHYLNKVYP